ncbi:class I SAM-dependent methyltransferase [Bdellovibrio sp. HCB185ZH]|uniref:class I SAM-dependent methyltransferase n=1 Tax=Bdellovibrio sp. HCB185ZH TaxID=3394235 RepID=UPI0039A7477C
MKLPILIFTMCLGIQTAFAAATNPLEAALSASSRSAEDKKADTDRRPKELLEFSKVKAGERVVDMMPGKGYFTKLFASVVGDKGHVTAFIPKEFESAPFKPVDATKEATKGLKNTSVAVTPILDAPDANADLVWTSQNYHDLHIKKYITVDMVAFNKMVFKMLKPGGRYVVIDHVAAAGATDADIERLHRIDPAMVKKEVEAAGFVLAEEGKILKREEPHTLNVFDPAIRGKTDQFVFLFVKPKK